MFSPQSPLTWKASLFLRCRLLSLRRVFCFSSSSSFSSARMCSSKQMRASSLSISVNTLPTPSRHGTQRVSKYSHKSLWTCGIIKVQTSHFFYLLNLSKWTKTWISAFILCSSSSSAKVGLSSRYCWASDQVVRYVTLAMLSKMFFRASQFLFLSCLACSWKRWVEKETRMLIVPVLTKPVINMQTENLFRLKLKGSFGWTWSQSLTFSFLAR